MDYVWLETYFGINKYKIYKVIVKLYTNDMLKVKKLALYHNLQVSRYFKQPAKLMSKIIIQITSLNFETSILKYL